MKGQAFPAFGPAVPRQGSGIFRPLDQRAEQVLFRERLSEISREHAWGDFTWMRYLLSVRTTADARNFSTLIFAAQGVEACCEAVLSLEDEYVRNNWRPGT